MIKLFGLQIVSDQHRRDDSAYQDPSELSLSLVTSRQLSPDEFSVMWDNMRVGKSKRFTLAATSSTDQIGMMSSIVNHLIANRFQITASGILENGMTVYCYAISEDNSMCLVEIKLNIINLRLGQEDWELSYACKCTDSSPPAVILFFKAMELDILFGSRDIN